MFSRFKKIMYESEDENVWIIHSKCQGPTCVTALNTDLFPCSAPLQDFLCCPIAAESGNKSCLKCQAGAGQESCSNLMLLMQNFVEKHDTLPSHFTTFLCKYNFIIPFPQFIHLSSLTFHFLLALNFLKFFILIEDRFLLATCLRVMG